MAAIKQVVNDIKNLSSAINLQYHSLNDSPARQFRAGRPIEEMTAENFLLCTPYPPVSDGTEITEQVYADVMDTQVGLDTNWQPLRDYFDNSTDIDEMLVYRIRQQPPNDTEFEIFIVGLYRGASNDKTPVGVSAIAVEKQG